MIVHQMVLFQKMTEFHSSSEEQLLLSTIWLDRYNFIEMALGWFQFTVSLPKNTGILTKKMEINVLR